MKEQSEIDRQRKLAEIMENQKQSHELRQKQQIERRKKIDDLKMREEERRKGVEQRRRELGEKEKVCVMSHARLVTVAIAVARRRQRRCSAATRSERHAPVSYRSRRRRR